jgi:hypothetical protein
MAEIVIRLWGEDRVEANVNRLRRLLNPHDPGASFKVDDLAGLIWACEDLAPIRYLAELFGLIVFALPAGREGADPIDQGTAKVLLETGKMLESIALARDPDSPGGSRLTASEKARIRPKLRQALSALLALDAAIEEGD